MMRSCASGVGCGCGPEACEARERVEFRGPQSSFSLCIARLHRARRGTPGPRGPRLEEQNRRGGRARWWVSCFLGV
eukprot:848183-Prymnesium_polylepis.1